MSVLIISSKTSIHMTRAELVPCVLSNVQVIPECKLDIKHGQGHGLLLLLFPSGSIGNVIYDLSCQDGESGILTSCIIVPRKGRYARIVGM
jgi:hypothetical protein